MKGVLAAAGILALWAGMVPLQNSIDLDRQRMPLAEKVNYLTAQDILRQAFTDFRIAVSNFLWIRVDQYLHLYAVREELEGKPVGEKREPKHEEGEEPEAHLDRLTPREQQIRRQMESEIMPLVRIVTWLDPNFVLAYQVGAWTLGDRLKKPEEAEKFLLEGIRHNPQRSELYSELGFNYFFYMKDYPKAAVAFTRALAYPVSTFQEKKKLIRMLAYCYEKSGDRRRAVAILENYVEIDPKNGKARQRLERLRRELIEEETPE